MFRSERGSATAEYAIATMAAVGFAGLLVVIMRSDEVRQMLLDLGAEKPQTLDTFVVGQNAELALLLQQFAQRATRMPDERFVYIWGEAGAGKTHLLQALAEHWQARGLRVAHAGDVAGEIARRLESVHDVQIVRRVDLGENILHRYDPDTRVLEISARLSGGQQVFKFATELAYLEHGDLLDSLVAEGNFTSAAGNNVRVSLAANPSHLEAVNPVLEGIVRAKLDVLDTMPESYPVVPVLIHGDAAFAGQGVVPETLNMWSLRGYRTGGTIHLIINNQIGFTTSDPRDMRSTVFCTDIVKMVEAPVLHVNGDDPEAVVLATQLALEFRMTFRQDVVVDITCFRKLGHNEQDTPSLTQPLMYKKIAAHPGTRRLYADRLAAQGLGESLGDDMVKSYRAALDAGRHTVDPVLTNFKSKFAVDWAPFLGKKWTDASDTAIPMTEWKRLAEKITTIPSTVTPHQLVKKVYDDRAAMGRGDVNVDWGMGEHMAFASLVASGYPVRLSGEDCGRGTFTHRHAVIHDQSREKWDTGTYVPLQNVADNQAPFVVIDSILSEEAVLAYEYGYASNDPNTLVIWEAQFGDFANGAQVVIDQFIASGEVKWGRVNGITLMLPHGYEGQGPEHSSARLERFMQLAADTNMQIVQPTTASQIFHVLRRQMVRNLRKPLIIMTPKSLLRNKDATSPLSEFTKGGFQTVIPENKELKNDKVKRVLVCSGKVYYDLAKKREENGANDVAILRVEQLYPFPHKAFANELKKYPNATEIVWTQDEPQNQGAWFFVQHYIHENMLDGQKLGYSGRAASASPAVGYSHLHQEQQKALVEGAFGKLKGFILSK